MYHTKLCADNYLSDDHCEVAMYKSNGYGEEWGGVCSKVSFLQQIHYWCMHDINKFALELHIYCFFWPVYNISFSLTSYSMHPPQSYNVHDGVSFFCTLKENFPLSNDFITGRQAKSHLPTLCLDYIRLVPVWLVDTRK